MQKQDVNEKVESLKKEIHEISSSLKELGGQKEDHYKQKNSLDKQLNRLISKAKTLKEKKRDIDKNISELKNKRELTNKEHKNLIHNIRREQKSSKKYMIPIFKIKKQIKDFEYKIQTEALNFKKEKQFMEKINKLKIELKQNLEIAGKFQTTKDNIEKAKNIKSKADEIHSQIQSLAGESSKIFEQLSNLSKNISTIKTKRNTVQLMLNALRTQMNQMNHKLSKILKDWSGVADKVILKTAKGIDKMFHKKTEEAKEKLKSKKKLTTDDILMLQREHLGK